MFERYLTRVQSVRETFYPKRGGPSGEYVSDGGGLSN